MRNSIVVVVVVAVVVVMSDSNTLESCSERRVTRKSEMNLMEEKNEIIFTLGRVL